MVSFLRQTMAGQGIRSYAGDGGRAQTSIFTAFGGAYGIEEHRRPPPVPSWQVARRRGPGLRRRHRLPRWPATCSPPSPSATIVGEYPPFWAFSRTRFLTRNRVIAALAAGAIIIEAGFSGALTAARPIWASR